MRICKTSGFFDNKKKLKNLEFAKNHYGTPDIAMFDFTSLYHADNASRF